jgi:sugar O-acyltransferase (sialic acid O-acetyltransferase NeuD family)
MAGAASRPIIVVGIGLLAEQVRFYFEAQAGRRIEAHAVDPDFLREATFQGRPVLAFDDAVRRYPPSTHDLFVAIGHTATAARRRKVLDARQLGYALPSFVHPSAHVAPGVRVGVNTLIQELAMVSPFVQLGDDVMLCPQVGINHHTRVGAHCFFGPAAVVCGDARIGEACFIGANSTIRDRVTVGDGCIIGAGAVVMVDCEPGGVYRAERTPRTRTLE